MTEHNHHHHDHQHARSQLIIDPDRAPLERHLIGRRQLLTDLGRGTLAIAVFGVTAAACSSQESGGSPPGGTTPSTTSVAKPGDTRAVAPATTAASAGSVTWNRISLGSVAAYALVRGREAAIVDTGNPGSEPAISKALKDLGFSMGEVKHVVVTHRHPDHAGSVSDILAAATGATAYAGEADISAIQSSRPLKAVGDGDEVFGLRIIATPGHTAGHISVLDPAGAFLIAGDALRTGPGGVEAPTASSDADRQTAYESVRKLSTMTFADVACGHGEPVKGNASSQVAKLASTL